MKKYLMIIPLFLVICNCILNCKKDPKPTNIVLYNKPLETIQQYIHGKWRLVYGKGGICGTCMFPCDNCFVEFTATNKTVSYTHLRAHETVLDLVCRLLLEKKKN